MNCGSAIRYLLHERQRTATDLAEKSGVSRYTIYNILKRDPVSLKPDIEKRILWAFGITHSEFEYIRAKDQYEVLYESHMITEIGEVMELKKIYTDISNENVYRLEINSKNLDMLRQIMTNEEVKKILYNAFFDVGEKVSNKLSPIPILYTDDDFTYDKKEEFENVITHLELVDDEEDLDDEDLE